MRYRADTWSGVTYVLDVAQEAPFVDVTFSVLRGARKVYEPAQRTYDSFDLAEVIDDLWSDPPRENGVRIYLENTHRLAFRKVA